MKENKQQLKEVWRQKVLVAERTSRIATANVQMIQDEYKSMATPDGDFAIRQALKAEELARKEYTRMLEAFTRLVLYGEEPPSDSNPT